MPSQVRRLTSADADIYHALRREMLVDSPWAFGSSPEQDRFREVEAVRRWFEGAERAIVGAFDDGATGPGDPSLAAAAGIMREDAIKRRHIASVFGVYCRPASRGRGLGRAVMAAAIEAARQWPGIHQIQLSVSEQSSSARALYESLGFVAWGLEPDCLRIDGRGGVGEVHMWLRLGGGAG